MRAKLIKEYGGAGFSYGGGSSIFPVNRGGQMNRGGFGGAANMGGPNMMYTYEIKALNRNLQPLVMTPPEIEIIHDGNDVSGQELNKKDGKIHVGILRKTVKSENGSLKWYEILCPQTNTMIKIDPTTARLISKTAGVDPRETDEEKARDKSTVDSPSWGELSGIYNESYYPQLTEAYEGGEALKRTLTRKSKLNFGKFGNETIQKLFDMKKTGYLRWVYYNITPINFFPDILEELGIVDEWVIDKPGTNKELGDELFQNKNKWREEQGKKYTNKRYALKQDVYNPEKIKHKPLDFRKEQ